MTRAQMIAIPLWLLLSITATAQENSPAPDFTGYDLQQRLVSLQDLRTQAGTKVVVVEFFSVFCKPCIEAMPKWIALHRKYHGKGLQVVVVAVRDRDDLQALRKDLRAWFEEHPVDFPVVLDKYSVIAGDFKVTTAEGSVDVPQIFVIQADGKVAVRTSKADGAVHAVLRELGVEVKSGTSPK